MPMHARPITANLWSLQAARPIGNPPIGPPALMGVPAFLQQTRSTWQYAAASFAAVQPRFLYIDRRTDAEVDVTGLSAGYAEVPAGTGQYYRILDVQDVERGLADEERRLVLIPQAFQVPIP
jgi:hypothetical protein